MISFILILDLIIWSEDPEDNRNREFFASNSESMIFISLFYERLKKFKSRLVSKEKFISSKVMLEFNKFKIEFS